MLRTSAHAKINLSLEVVGRRPDGYHDLVSIMQLISLHDEIEVEPADEISLMSSDPELATEDNLAFRAAALLAAKADPHVGASIRLDKYIPVAAGLGGGSSDAAATLIALSDLWEIETSCEQLHALAGKLGSDVPFFLYGGTCLVEGRGERVTPLQLSSTSWYLLVKPPVGASTRDVFDALTPDRWTDGSISRAMAKDIAHGRELAAGVNALQWPLFELCPEARRCFEAVSAVAPGQPFVSGSGPTVIARFSGAAEAERASESLEGSGFWTCVAHSIPRSAVPAPCA